MSESQKIVLTTPEQLLRNNPKVSKSVVAQFADLEQKLEKLGVDTKPHYSLSPPFGWISSDLLKKYPPNLEIASLKVR